MLPRRRSVVFIPLPVAFFAVPMPRFHRGAAPAEHPLFSARLLISLLCRAGCSLPGAAPVQQAPAMSRPIHGVQFSPKRLLPGASSPRAQPRPCFPSLSAPCIHGTRQLWLGCSLLPWSSPLPKSGRLCFPLSLLVAGVPSLQPWFPQLGRLFPLPWPRAAGALCSPCSD